MKKWILRATALALALQLTAGTVHGVSVLQQGDLPLSDSLNLTSNFVDSDQMIKEHILTYTPGGDVQPMVVFGTTLYGKSTMDTMANHLKKQGLTPVGAVNAAFFDMRNGLPIGMVVTDGLLRINGFDNVVGIEADGTLKIGAPTISVYGRWGSEEILLHYNQLLTENNGMILYSRDYDNKTKGDIPGYHVVLEAEDPTLGLDSKLTCTVTKIVENTRSCAIPEGGYVLSLAEKYGYEPFQNAIRKLEVGDTVTVTTAIDDDWRDVVYAVGGGDLLVRNGSALSQFGLDSAERPAARTALGIRADGSVVCYTVDNSYISGGLTLAELADRMAELDCLTAINLDGGGSTCVGMTQPGTADFITVNDPSDGQQRACANYLFFVRPTTTGGTAEHLYIYPYDQAVLAGEPLRLSAMAADENYMPAALPGSLSWSASRGSIIDGVLTAGGEGTTVVTAYSGPLTGTVQVHVVRTPSAMTILRQDTGKKTTEILIECGTSLDLTATASYLGMDLAARDQSFLWSVPAELGTIDDSGLFTAGDQEVKAVLTVSCGDRTVELPVETRINPMVDLKGHWAREYISNLYFRDILKGGENGAGELVFRPDDSMTRQEFVVSMIRWLGVDTADYADVELPFADEKQIADWAVDAVKAAYEQGYFTGSQSGKKLYADPTATITREAAMTLLARTLKAESDSDVLENYSDAKKVSEWARPALTAMVERGVINGIDGKLQPQSSVTRAQVAKMLFAME